MSNDASSEKRIDELREQAWKEGVVPGKGVDVAGGPIPRKPGYYGQPVVKPPVWTWEVPLYFFFGGMAGMSAVIASGAIIFHQLDVTRAAMWVACIAGAILSPVLLIMDLGRPHLFLNMLRVFKHRTIPLAAVKIALLGATGNVGRRVLAELLRRGIHARAQQNCRILIPSFDVLFWTIHAQEMPNSAR
jgi:Polysulphide reductase, NrfD